MNGVPNEWNLILLNSLELDRKVKNRTLEREKKNNTWIKTSLFNVWPFLHLFSVNRRTTSVRSVGYSDFFV